MDVRMQTLGYIQSSDVTGRYSIADLFPKSKRCGIYLLEFSDGLCYIGKSNDVVRRFAQHRNRYDDIVKFYFKAVPKKSLDEAEILTIHAAPGLGIQLINRDHVSVSYGDAELDDIILPAQQKEWFVSPDKYQQITFRMSDDALRNRHRKQFERFKRRPDADRVTQILRHYVRCTIPAYRKTETSFWSLSCMPSTNASTSPRVSCCNLRNMEVFVIGYSRHNPEKLWSFVIVSHQELGAYADDRTLEAKYQSVEIFESDYKSAGPDQVRIEIDGLDEIEAILSDEGIVRAARRLNLNLMRKGATVYSQYHCLDLADLIV